MKKFNLSLVAVLAMSTFAVAGGDIVPVEEPVVVVPEVIEEVTNNNGFYLGLAYSATSIDVDGYDDGGYALGGDDTDSFMVQVGYKFNPYIAVEARYWNGDNGVDAYGLYAKPMYPVTDAFDVYGLLGYGNAAAEPTDGYIGNMSLDDSTFQWGLGASYAFTDSFAVFADYVELYNSDYNGIDYSLDAVNFGVTYQF